MSAADVAAINAHTDAKISPLKRELDDVLRRVSRVDEIEQEIVDLTGPGGESGEEINSVQHLRRKIDRIEGRQLASDRVALWLAEHPGEPVPEALLADLRARV